MKKTIILLIVLVSIFQIGCVPDTVEETTTYNPLINNVKEKPIDVYVAGALGNQACYWKNDEVVMLQVDGSEISSANKIIISNGNIYILGQIEGERVYWKNNELTYLKNALELDGGTLMGVSVDMDVVSDDVYFSGYLFTNESYTICSWKNNIKTNLSNNLKSDVALTSNIKVVDNDVYVTGCRATGAQYVSIGYYINNEFYDLNAGSFHMVIANNESKVYIAGNKDSHDSSDSAAFYENVITNKRVFPELLAQTRITKMVFDNNDMYYTSGDNIYKNDQLIYSQKETNDVILDLEVKNGKLYVIINHDGKDKYMTVEINESITMIGIKGEEYRDIYIVA